MISAAGIPVIEGDMDALAAHARALSSTGSAFADTGAQVNATWQGLAGVYQAPEVAQLLTATAPVQSISGSLGADIETVGTVLGGYASEVREIKARLEALRAQAGAFEAAVAGDDDWADDDANVERNNELIAAVNAAVADFQAAQRRCANAINALYGGQQYRADDGDGQREPGEYGYTAEQLGAAADQDGALPWGSTADKDRGLLGDIGAFFVGVKDGAVGMVEDLGALIGRNPATGEWSWGMAGTAWAGVGKFALAAAMAANRPGMLVSGDSAAVPGIFDKGEASTLLREAGKSFIAYDQWGEDNARAAGHATFNVVSAIVGTKGATAGLKGMGTAAAGSRVGAVSAAGSAMVRGADYIGKLPTVDDVAIRAGHQLPGFNLPDVGAGVDVTHHVDIPGSQLNGTGPGHTPSAAPTPGSVGDALSRTPDTTASAVSPDRGSADHPDIPDQRGADSSVAGMPGADTPATPAGSDRASDSGAGRPKSIDTLNTHPVETTAGPHLSETAPDTSEGDSRAEIGSRDAATDATHSPGDAAPAGEVHGDGTSDGVHTAATDDATIGGAETDAVDRLDGDASASPEGLPEQLGNQPDGSWVNVEHGTRFELTPEHNAAADQYLSGARADEAHISPDITALKDRVDGAQTQGYPDYVVKGEDSFKRKFADDLEKYPDLSADQVLANIKDSVRYTIEIPPRHYADGVLQAIDDLRARGYENVTFKPTWAEPDTYKGVNSTWRDPDTGRVFELQFHTPDSFDAKTSTHELYEAERVATTDVDRQRAADAQAEIFRQVDVPDGAVDRLNELRGELDDQHARADANGTFHSPDGPLGREPDIDTADSLFDRLDADAPADPGGSGAEDTGSRSADWSDVSGVTDVNSLPAAHAETTTPDQAQRYIAQNHPYTSAVNAEQFANNVPGSRENCSRCVHAIANGFSTGGPSTALPWPGGPTGWGMDSQTFDQYAYSLGADPGDYHSVSSYDEIIQDVMMRGEGSQGMVYIFRPRPMPTAHVFNVVHDHNGVVFLDGQTGGLALLEKNVAIEYLPIKGDR